MYLQPADRTLSFPKGILKNLCIRVGTLYAPADFVVIETGTDERVPIILGRLVLPRSVSTSRGGRRLFPSRTRLHKSQSNPDMNQGRGPTGRIGTSKYRPSQLRWSLQFKEVIDMGEDEYDPPIILGRPFLSTVKALIYIVEDSKQVRTRRRQRNRNHRRQIIKDGWADYKGEVVRSADIQLEQNCPEETVAPSQVWREKTVIHEEEASPEPPTTPSSES